jgi:hypothetical protein
MTSSKPFLLFAAIAASAGGPASAQFPSLPGMGGLGGLSGISSMGMGNAAGVLGYCLKNNLLGGASAGGATDVLSSLTKKPGVAGSTGYTAGQAGNILSGSGGNALSLGSLNGNLKSQACGMVLKQAQKFL